MNRIHRIVVIAATAFACLTPGVPARAAPPPEAAASAVPLVLAPHEPDAPSVVRTYPGAAPCNTTLQACISASADGDTVRISAGTYVTASISITRAVSVIGAGANPLAVRLRPTGGRMFTIAAATMSAGNVISNVTIENAVTSSGSGGAIRVNSGSGAPLFHSLVISNNAVTFGGAGGGSGGGIRVIPSVPVTMVSVLVFSNTATGNGGGVSVSGPLTLIGSQISRNRTITSGGGLEVGGALVMTGSLVLTNTAVFSGGGIFAGAAVTIENSTIASNTASLGGGLASIGTDAIVISGATTFKDNRADVSDGGGVLARGDVRLAGGLSLAGRTLFKGNRAHENGGGIASRGNVYFSRGFPHSIYAEFDDNLVVAGGGGGIHAAGVVGWLQSSVRLRMINNAALFGGAVYAGASLDVFLDPLDAFATLQGNTAVVHGGALYSEGNAILRSGVNHAGNVANNHGGLLYAAGDATIVGADTSLTGAANSALRGGCVYADGNVTLNNGMLAKCSAGETGGGARAGGWLRALNGAQVLSGTAQTGGGLFATTFLTVEDGSLLRGNAASAAGGGARGLSVLIRDATLISNTALVGGAISATVAHITNAVLMSNTARFAGGALNVAAAAFITHATFTANRITDTNGVGGGAVFAAGSVVLNGGAFLSNTASNVQGGAIAGRFITATGAAFVGNVAQSGGAISATAALVHGGVFTRNGGTNTRQGGGIFAITANVSGTRFIGNEATGCCSTGEGGGIRASNGSVWFSYFEANSAYDEGAAVYFTGTVSISNSQFIRNVSSSYRASAARLGRISTVADSLFEDNEDSDCCEGGGAIDAPNPLSLEIRNSTFNHNRAEDGGAVRAAGSLFVNGSTFFDNVSDCCGSGGAIWTGSADIINSTFISNYADCCDGGGAVHAFAGGLFVQGSRFISNTVEERMDGGAILADGFLTVNDSTFDNNRVRKAGANNVGRGGAVALEFGGSATIDRSQFTNNRANHGGAVACRGVCEVTDSRFESNLADQPDSITFTNIGRGGAIEAQDTLLVERSRFLRNVAGAGGGGAIHQSDTTPAAESVRIVNSLFAENLASNAVLGAQGTAVLITGTANVGRLLHNTIVSDTPAPGSAVSVYSGTFSAIDNIVVNHAAGIEHFGPGSTFENVNLFSGNGVNVSGTVTSGGGSFVAAPQFISPLHDVYHLKVGSPGIDAGMDVLVAEDIDGQPRPQGAGFDIGFDEGGLPRVYVPSTMRSRSTAW